MIGDRLGKWVIFKELGRGGMGRVYLAQEEIGGRQAALKILAAELAQDAGFLHRFQREIETLSKLDHPGIVRFYEAGYENGMYFYAMEYVEGQSLEEVLEAQGRLPWQDVLDIALKVCPALRHVHDNGIIHRDLKPPNILRTPDGGIKLTDFGIAKIFASSHLTATGGVVGTAEFLSPEQAAGKPVSKRSDLYSLGVVLYTLLTGRTPFSGGTFLELLHKHRYGQFDRPQRIVPDIPYELDEVVCQLLEKDPDKRPPDCHVLFRTLDSIRRKLDRKSSQTRGDVADEVTLAENRVEVDLPGAPGPATLMSKLVRAELERQTRSGPLARLLNRGWVLMLLLAICISIFVWTFWPMSSEAMFRRGADLMASERPTDWRRAWNEYFKPLNDRYPDHPYQEEVQKYRQKIDDAELAEQTPSEAQRFFARGERLRQEGRFSEAKKVWENLIAAFGNTDSERMWIRRSEKALVELEQVAGSKQRLAAARTALERAAILRDQGKRAEAERIWTALEELYRDDPWARNILAEIGKARGN
jgi:predicted Ser/Thr protein kinase